VKAERELDELRELAAPGDRADLHCGTLGHGAEPTLSAMSDSPTQRVLASSADVFAKVRDHERAEQLEAAKQGDLLPYFRVLTSQAGPVVEMEGRETIMLGSNNYLGLTTDERVKQAARDALETFGTGVTGSRLLNGTTPLHIALERELAEWMGTDDAIVFTTGYQANLGCIGTILEPGDTVICDSGDHASILDGCRLSGAKLRPFRHNRMEKLEKMLERAAGDGGGVLVVVDGVFSMEGDLCDLPPIVELCERFGARLLVDEAHGVGVLGARGAGACELFGLEDRVDLRMGTFSKSLASCGGFIAGPADVVEYLRVASRSFIFSASAVPAAVGAALGALRVIRAEGPALFDRLLGNAAYLRQGFRELGLVVVEPGRLPDGTEATTPVVPVIVGEDWQAVLLWKALFDAGVYTNVAIHPAVPPAGALLRTSLMATHERSHLDRALEIIERVVADFPDLPRSA
jgi:8-amino-7-oxononanoate synthase